MSDPSTPIEPLAPPPEASPVAAPPVGARPLSTPLAIGISGLTAAVVMALGVLLAERFAPPRDRAPALPPPPASLLLSAGSAPPASSLAPAIAAPSGAAQVVTAPPSASVPARSSVALTPPEAPPRGDPPLVASVASVDPSPPSTARDPSQLPPKRGVLRVRGPASAHVYIKGHEVGLLDTSIEVPCGFAFVRLGTPVEGARHPTWIGEGKSIVIACRAETQVVFGDPPRP
jgi:hypothetical protein